MQVTCPHCNRRLHASGRLAGSASSCPYCHGKYAIPLPTAPLRNSIVVAAPTSMAERARTWKAGRRAHFTHAVMLTIRLASLAASGALVYSLLTRGDLARSLGDLLEILRGQLVQH